jgi:AcrR family transcriptional regulator
MNQHALTGLRERKKARTRAAIRRQALRLFRQRGYAATTVDQIAEAADVSPSTFFRYFPTKEDTVLQDDLDEPMLHALRAQPPGVSIVQALRDAMRSVLAELPPDELAQERERVALVFSVPELRARTLDRFWETTRMFAQAVAEREGRPPDHFAIRNLVGAVIGVSMSTMVAALENPGVDYYELLDSALAHLDAGLPL